MDNIFIEETINTPEISFNYRKGLLEIKGVSIPEDTQEFYQTLLEYFKEYIQKNENEQTIVHFKLIYVNTSSTAIIIKIISFLEQLEQTGSKVLAKWYYEEGDDDMEEMGSDFQAISKVPFKLIETDEMF